MELNIPSTSIFICRAYYKIFYLHSWWNLPTFISLLFKIVTFYLLIIQPTLLQALLNHYHYNSCKNIILYTSNAIYIFTNIYIFLVLRFKSADGIEYILSCRKQKTQLPLVTGHFLNLMIFSGLILTISHS